MKIIRTISGMQAQSSAVHAAGKKLGVVPTMGYLHEGHMSLVDIAKRHSDFIVVTIYVNPTQFAPTEDLAKYPRDPEHDSQLCESRGVDAIFLPEDKEMYSTDASTWVTEDSLSTGLCGRSRPTHFRGVCTVVAKLFNAALPDIAVFGEKDYQQALIIKRMTRDLNFPVRIITAPIVRENDGLAMSSRNKYLSDDERRRALSIRYSLLEAEDAVRKGEKSTAKISDSINLRISQTGGKPDYIEIVDAETLASKNIIEGKILIAVAAVFGRTRLIDNILVS